MKAVYLDTSILLRVLFDDPKRIQNWGHWKEAVASDLIRVESLRAIDRHRIEGHLRDEEVATWRTLMDNILDRIGIISVSVSILDRAAQPFPTVVGTLDAIHLASALLWQERTKKSLTVLTHDRQMGIAAKALGLASDGFGGTPH